MAMTPFANDQYIMLGLMFVLGLVLGMYLLAGGKWKRRYKEEARLRAELETENKRLRGTVREHDSLRASTTTTSEHVDVDRHPVSGTAAQPEPRPGGRWGFGRAKH
jgi:hypothetical protein